MPSAEFLAALNDVYYIAMPMFNESAIAGAPAELKAVFQQLSDGGSTIDDIAAGIATENPNSGVTPEIVYQILIQLEQSGLVAHSDAVSGYNGMIISNSANNVLGADSLILGNMFSPERVAPVLSSSQSIAELGAREDQAIINSQNPLVNAANVPLSASSPEIMVSDPNIAVSNPPIGSAVPSISSSPEIKASTPQIGFGQNNNA
jgi:hypothetical protein